MSATPRADDRAVAERTLALARLGLIPVMFAAERLGPHHEASHDLFAITLAVATCYAASVAWATFTLRRGPPGWLVATIDLGLLCALTYQAGGATSELRRAFVLLPVGAAFLLRPRLTAAWSLIALAAYLAVLFAHPATDTVGEVRLIASFALYIAWAGVVATLLALALARRRERITELRQRASRLVAQVLDAEDRERRHIAEALHEDALQNVLAARQDVAAALRGDASGLTAAVGALDQAVAQLRNQVFRLDPRVLEQAGLAPALRAIADDEARRAHFSCSVEVDPAAADVDDQLVFSLARELLSNAAKHACAANVTVAVRRVADEIVVEVGDDGDGLDSARRQAAFCQGHIGLASCQERIEALGGWFAIGTGPGRGTVVRVGIPAQRDRRRVARTTTFAESQTPALVAAAR
jgi:two-component system NarL family sensor kinase